MLGLLADRIGRKHIFTLCGFACYAGVHTSSVADFEALL